MEVVIKSSHTQNLLLRTYYFVFYPERIYGEIKNEKLWISLFITWFISFISFFYIFLISGIFEIVLKLTDLIYLRDPITALFSEVFYGAFMLSFIVSVTCFLAAAVWYFFFQDFKRSSYELIVKSFLYSSLIPIIIWTTYRLIQIIISLVMDYSYIHSLNSNAIISASVMIFHWGTFFDYIVFALMIVNFFYFFVKSMSYFLREKESKIFIKSITPTLVFIAIVFVLVRFVLPALFPSTVN